MGLEYIRCIKIVLRYHVPMQMRAHEHAEMIFYRAPSHTTHSIIVSVFAPKHASVISLCAVLCVCALCCMCVRCAVCMYVHCVQAHAGITFALLLPLFLALQEANGLAQYVFHSSDHFNRRSHLSLEDVFLTNTLYSRRRSLRQSSNHKTNSKTTYTKQNKYVY